MLACRYRVFVPHLLSHPRAVCQFVSICDRNNDRWLQKEWVSTLEERRAFLKNPKLKEIVLINHKLFKCLYSDLKHLSFSSIFRTTCYIWLWRCWSKNNNIVKYYLFYLSVIQCKCVFYSCDGKTEFSAAITLVSETRNLLIH